MIHHLYMTPTFIHLHQRQTPTCIILIRYINDQTTETYDDGPRCGLETARPRVSVCRVSVTCPCGVYGVCRRAGDACVVCVPAARRFAHRTSQKANLTCWNLEEKSKEKDRALSKSNRTEFVIESTLTDDPPSFTRPVHVQRCTVHLCMYLAGFFLPLPLRNSYVQ